MIAGHFFSTGSRSKHVVVLTRPQLQPHGFPPHRHADRRRHRTASFASHPWLSPDKSHKLDISSDAHDTCLTTGNDPALTTTSQPRHGFPEPSAPLPTRQHSNNAFEHSQHCLPDRVTTAQTWLSKRRHGHVAATSQSCHGHTAFRNHRNDSPSEALRLYSQRQRLLVSPRQGHHRTDMALRTTTRPRHGFHHRLRRYLLGTRQPTLSRTPKTVSSTGPPPQ